MNQSPKRAHRLLAAAAGSTLCLGLAIGAGAVPLPATTASIRTAAASPGPIWAALPSADAAAPVAAEAPTTEVTVPPAPAEVAKKAPARAKPSAATAAVASSSLGASVTSAAEAAAPTLAPRRQPSSSEVQAAIQGLQKFVRSIFSPSAAQIAEGGDNVCTAFDEGQTFAQIKATALAMVAKVPFTSVSAGADDYVVRTAVTLYCPDYASRLV